MKNSHSVPFLCMSLTVYWNFWTNLLWSLSKKERTDGFETEHVKRSDSLIFMSYFILIVFVGSKLVVLLSWMRMLLQHCTRRGLLLQMITPNLFGSRFGIKYHQHYDSKNVIDWSLKISVYKSCKESFDNTTSIPTSKRKK